VVEVSNRSTAPARYLMHTADWTFAPDFSVSFHDELQPGSCRPWVAIERPEIVVPGGGTLRYRFEVNVPADAPAGECRFAVMIEGLNRRSREAMDWTCRSPGASVSSST